jgi:hypothetical protein
MCAVPSYHVQRHLVSYLCPSCPDGQEVEVERSQDLAGPLGFPRVREERLGRPVIIWLLLKISWAIVALDFASAGVHRIASIWAHGDVT